MRIYSPAEILEKDFTFQNILPLRQMWKRRNYSYRENPRPDQGILLVTGGQIDYVTAASTIHVSAGDIIYLPKGCFYEAIFYPGIKQVTNLLINFDMMDDLGEFIMSACPFLLLSNAASHYQFQFEAIVSAFYGSPRSFLLLKSLLYRLMYDLLSEQQCQQFGTTFQTVEHIITMLSEIPDKPISQIAQACGISESSLRRTFKQYTGTSPAQYRLDSKMRQAEKLLATSNMSPKEICFSLGFYDEAYFYRLFRIRTGMTPLDYRSKARSQQISL